MADVHDEKICASCGRRFGWRRKWANDWEHVRHCSSACRQRGVNDIDRRLEATILDLLKSRASGASICPSEAARVVEPDDWRPLMEPARRAARRLAHAGTARITQKGRPVDPSDFKGPIRITRA